MTHASQAARVAALAEGLADVLRDPLPPPARRELQRALAAITEAQEYLQERAESAAAGGAAWPWYVMPPALDRWCAIVGTHHPSALAGLIDACRAATYRQTDPQGRELWRCGRGHGNVRLVVDPRAGERQDDLPVLLWVGQGRPPRWCWESVDRAQQTPTGRRER